MIDVSFLHLNFASFSGIMSAVVSQQLPKEDEEEEDEELGEEFVFDDTTDEETSQEDTKENGSNSVLLTKHGDSETQTDSDANAQLPRTSPPAGQEGISTRDSIPTAGKAFS